jgi:aspartate kinase
MIVMKFGGSSVESAETIQRVAGIVRERLAQRPVVVVSAMGKTTNKLLAMAGKAAGGDLDGAVVLLEDLRESHLRAISEPRAPTRGRADAGHDVASQINAILDQLADLVKGLAIVGELTPRATDAVSAFGERLSSLIVTAQFQAQGIDAAHVDARTLIVTDRRQGQAAPLFAETNAKLMAVLPQLAQAHVPVMGGFIASNEDGVTTTLGRGGSDYTASIVGAGIGAEEIQIWTDVDGMLTADPTIFPGGHRVETCSFAEAAELAYFGAKVLHPATVLPAIEKNIPVRILNSRRPQVEGTLIVSDPPPASTPIRSIACKRNITLVNIVSSRMLMAHGFLRRIFEIFDRHETSVDMLATSEISVSLTVDNTRALDTIRAEIAEFAEITMEDNHAIVCLVGENIRNCPAVAARVFKALGSIKTRMVSQGASQLNISLVVSAANLAHAVESLHREFFT